MNEEKNKKEKYQTPEKQKSKKGFWAELITLTSLGWDIVIPMVLGIMAGAWLDRHYPGSLPWTIILAFVGIILGAVNGWKWVKKEIDR